MSLAEFNTNKAIEAETNAPALCYLLHNLIERNEKSNLCSLGGAYEAFLESLEEEVLTAHSDAMHETTDSAKRRQRDLREDAELVWSLLPHMSSIAFNSLQSPASSPDTSPASLASPTASTASSTCTEFRVLKRNLARRLLREWQESKNVLLSLSPDASAELYETVSRFLLRVLASRRQLLCLSFAHDDISSENMSPTQEKWLTAASSAFLSILRFSTLLKDAGASTPAAELNNLNTAIRCLHARDGIPALLQTSDSGRRKLPSSSSASTIHPDCSDDEESTPRVSPQRDERGHAICDELLSLLTGSVRFVFCLPRLRVWMGEILSLRLRTASTKNSRSNELLDGSSSKRPKYAIESEEKCTLSLPPSPLLA